MFYLMNGEKQFPVAYTVSCLFIKAAPHALELLELPIGYLVMPEYIAIPYVGSHHTLRVITRFKDWDTKMA